MLLHPSWSAHGPTKTASVGGLARPWCLGAALCCLLAAAACSDNGAQGADDDGGDRQGADGSGNGGVDGGGVGPSCVSLETTVTLQSLDMLIALDTSESMYYERKWPAVTGAIKAFVGDASFSGMGVGLELFSEARPCNVEDYEAPDVAIAELPGVQTAIEEALTRKDGALQPSTPTVPMLQGVFKQAVERAEAEPERRVVAVLATDGIPAGCFGPSGPQQLTNSLDNVVLLAKQAFEGKPSIPLFVVGVGSDLELLDDVAAAGGTGTAFFPDVSGDLASSFLGALDEIRRKSVSCTFEIPDVGDDFKIDTDRVNVRLTLGDKEEIFTNVTNEQGCETAPAAGWHYDDPDDPKSISLCPETCDRLQRSTGATLEVLFGCKVVLI